MGDDHGAATVRDGRAVQFVQRVRDHLGGEDILDGDAHGKLGHGVLKGVSVVLHRDQRHLFRLQPGPVHVGVGLHRAGRDHVHSEFPFVNGVEGRIGDQAGDALRTLGMTRDQGCLVGARQRPRIGVKGAERPVALHAGNILGCRAACVTHGHERNRAPVPEIAGRGHDVVDVVDGHPRIVQRPVHGLPGHVGKGFPLLFRFDLRHSDADNCCSIHVSSLPDRLEM